MDRSLQTIIFILSGDGCGALLCCHALSLPLLLCWQVGRLLRKACCSVVAGMAA